MYSFDDFARSAGVHRSTAPTPPLDSVVVWLEGGLKETGKQFHEKSNLQRRTAPRQLTQPVILS